MEKRLVDCGERRRGELPASEEIKRSTKRGRNTGKKWNRVTGREKINCSVEEQTMRLHQRVWSSRDLQKRLMPGHVFKDRRQKKLTFPEEVKCVRREVEK